MMKWIALQSVALVILLCSMASACPMCRDSTAADNGGAGSPPAPLFNASVLYILAAFAAVVGILAMKIVGTIRQVNRSVAEQNG